MSSAMKASTGMKAPAATRFLAALAVLLPGLALALALTGCFSNNPDAVKEHTADITAAAKRNAGQVAKGVFEGLTRKGPLDLNTANTRDFEKLPGITPALARAMLANRPYDKPSDLVARKILTMPQFNRIKAQITVKAKTPTP